MPVKKRADTISDMHWLDLDDWSGCDVCDEPADVVLCLPTISSEWDDSDTSSLCYKHHASVLARAMDAICAQQGIGSLAKHRFVQDAVWRERERMDGDDDDKGDDGSDDGDDNFRCYANGILFTKLGLRTRPYDPEGEAGK